MSVRTLLPPLAVEVYGVIEALFLVLEWMRLIVLQVYTATIYERLLKEHYLFDTW